MDKRKLRTEEQAELPQSSHLDALASWSRSPEGRAVATARTRKYRARMKAGLSPTDKHGLNPRVPTTEKTLATVRFHLSRGREAAYIISVTGWSPARVLQIINQIQTESK